MQLHNTCNKMQIYAYLLTCMNQKYAEICRNTTTLNTILTYYRTLEWNTPMLLRVSCCTLNFEMKCGERKKMSWEFVAKFALYEEKKDILTGEPGEQQ